MWSLAIDRGNKNPLWGDYFSKNTSIFAFTNQAYLPVHNDYLELYANGGIFSLIAFITLVALIIKNQITSILAIKKYNKHISQIYTMIFIGFINIIIYMAFNPLINDIPMGLPAFLLIGILLNYEDYVKSR